MKVFVKKSLLLIMICFCVFSLFACGETEKKNSTQEHNATNGVEYDISGDKAYAEVLGYMGIQNDILLANTYKGLPVERINDKAFYHSSIYTISMPSTIKVIGDSAFYASEKLRAVELKNGIEIIEKEAFYDCVRLSTINFPKSIKEIGNRAFQNCESLKEIIIPSGVEIGEFTFAYCNNLVEVTIGKNCVLGRGAFVGEVAKTIKFQGTKREWESLLKDAHWKESTNWRPYTVICTDGNLTV